MIYVECNPDEILVRYLGFRRGEVEHLSSMPEVVKSTHKYEATIGMIDQDPDGSKPGYLKQFQIIQRLTHIVVRKHRQHGSVLVVLCPRLEDWLILAAKNARIDMRKLGLPNKPNQLHEQIASSRTEKVRAKLTPLLNALESRKSKFLSDLRKALTQSRKRV